MGRELFSVRGMAVNDVENTIRQSGFAIDLRQLHRRGRGEGGRLEDHRIATGQSRAGFPAGDLHRIIPSADPDTDAEWFAARIGEGLSEIEMLAMQRRSDAREIFDR